MQPFILMNGLRDNLVDRVARARETLRRHRSHALPGGSASLLIVSSDGRS
jgi:hypothetical protein